MLVAAMVGIDTRSTMDMYATIKGIPFSEVFKNTAEKRGSYNRFLETGHDRMGEIERSQVLADLWSRYHHKNSYADDLTWVQVIASVKALYLKAFVLD